MNFEMESLKIDQEAFFREKWSVSQSDVLRMGIENYFDNWASPPGFDFDYDTSAVFSQYNPGQTLFDKMRDMPLKDKVFVDVGCGTGRSCVPFIQYGVHMDGVDISNEMLKRAKERGYGRLIQRDLAMDCFDDLSEQYDGMISIGVLGEWLPPRVLPRFLDMLSNNSTVAIAADLNERDNNICLGLLEERGFEIVSNFKDFSYFRGRVSVDYFYTIAER